MCDVTRAPCSAARLSKAKRRNPEQFSRRAILIAITLVWLIGQGLAIYVYESRVDRSGNGGAIAEGCGSPSRPQKAAHSRLN
jgi:hypothetical protein